MCLRLPINIEWVELYAPSGHKETVVPVGVHEFWDYKKIRKGFVVCDYPAYSGESIVLNNGA
jgi:hypothetical protein